MDTFFYLTFAAIAILGVVTLVGCLLTLPETRRIRARLRDLTARAESLLENTGGFVEHQELLHFRRTSPWGKQRELETLAAQREAEGWLYWKITAANPLRTVGSWGGGVTVHFVRPSAREPHEPRALPAEA